MEYGIVYLLTNPVIHHTDVTEEVSDEIENDLTDDDKAASAKAQIHRPPLNFYEMGMQKGKLCKSDICGNYDNSCPHYDNKMSPNIDFVLFGAFR